MSKNTGCSPNLRFKPVEGFLRRIAYNLGNSPSQTEVKIISCIPIDVTDLQQKIFQLQQELKEAQQSTKVDAPKNKNSVFHTAICDNTLCPACSAKYEGNAGVSQHCCLDSSSIISIRHPVSSSKPLGSKYSFLWPNTLHENSTFAERHPNTANTERTKTRSLFSRKKKQSKKKCRTQFVYCAQTNVNSPFQTSFSLSDDLTSKNFFKESNTSNKKVPLSSSYLASVLERQYKPHPMFTLSDISPPVCRDNNSMFSQSLPIESDVCSCCHGQFHNIDDHINNRNPYNEYPTCESRENPNRNAYYDSNFYDLVPVKEKPLKIKPQIHEILKRKEPLKPLIKCRPEQVRSKPAPNIVNYCTVSSVREHNVKRFATKAQYKKDIVLNKMAPKRIEVNPILHSQRDIDHPELSSVDYSPVYSKRPKNQKKQRILSPYNKKRNAATFMPSTINNADCQTVAVTADNPPGDDTSPEYSTPEIPITENKTETTLNQIKSILQSVLTEVKETKLGKPVEPPKKDAVVGPSQGNVFGGSQLLQSYTYSPYNMNPYIASCSNQIPPNNYTYPSLQDRCVQQFPLLVQPQKHMCTNCYRNSNIGKSNTKHAASAATNTDSGRPQGRSNETEQLIKEIYKSMALNVDLPSSKDNTVGDYTKLNNLKDSSVKACDKDSKYIAKAISEIFRNTNPPETTDTRDTDETVVSKLTSNKATAGSENVSKRYRMYNYTDPITSTTETIDRETEQLSRNIETEVQSDYTVVNEDTDPTTTETESDGVVVHIKEKEKKREKNGIFKKMLKIFQPRQRHKRKEDVQDDDEETESDSDDYQTVYSHKTAAPVPRKVNVRSRPHSKVFYSKQLQQRGSRTRSPEKKPRLSPYMEQEYRRQWDEQLMFHDNQPKRYFAETSRKPKETPRMRKPVYYQSYEARNLVVDPIRQVPLRMPGNVMKQQYTTSNGSPRYSYDYSGHRPNCPGNRVNYIRNDPNPNQPGKSRNNTNNSTYSGNKPHFVTAKSNVQRKNNLPGKGLAWLKSRKLGLQCGPQWKELVLNG